MVIVSYIASFVATVLGLIEPFGKNMKAIFIFNFSGNFLVGLSYFFVEEPALTGALICCVACCQVIINFAFETKKKPLPMWLIILHAVAFTAVNLLVFAAWYDVLALLASLLFVLSLAQTNASNYRIYYFLNSGLWIVYDFLAKAYGNLFTHGALFIATLIAIFIRDRKNKNKTISA